MLQRRQYSRAVDTWALGVIVFVLVCGCLPFDDDASTVIPDSIVKSKFKLRFPRWSRDLSPSARDLLSHLLNVNPHTRYTAEQALRHPWVVGSTAPKDSLLQSPGRILRPEMKSPHSGKTAANMTQMNQVMAVRAQANSSNTRHRQMVRKKSIWFQSRATLVLWFARRWHRQMVRFAFSHGLRMFYDLRGNGIGKSWDLLLVTGYACLVFYKEITMEEMQATFPVCT